MSERRKAGEAIVVTGAAGGIGGAIARRLLRDGWRVAATDLESAEYESAGLDGDFGESLALLAMDVASAPSVAAAAGELKRRDIHVAGLVNAAGLLQDISTLLSMDDAHQRRIWDVNYFGCVACTQVFGKMMIDNGGGAIVKFTSINEHRPLPLHAYAPTKVALGALTQLSAGEFGPRGIRVNAIAPGFTLTAVMREKIRAGKRNVGAIERATAMGRLVEPEEIASVASFLLSDEASAITGVSIPVDAGWMAAAHWMNFRDLQQDAASNA